VAASATPGKHLADLRACCRACADWLLLLMVCMSAAGGQQAAEEVCHAAAAVAVWMANTASCLRSYGASITSLLCVSEQSVTLIVTLKFKRRCNLGRHAHTVT
jgi:hypothetical protein